MFNLSQHGLSAPDDRGSATQILLQPSDRKIDLDWFADHPVEQPIHDLPPWHAKNPGNLANAIAQAKLAAPHLAELADFLLPRIPVAVLATSTIKGETEKDSSGRLMLENAVWEKWLSYNTVKSRAKAKPADTDGHVINLDAADGTAGRVAGSTINTVGVDADRPGWRKRLEAAIAKGLAPPAFVVASPWKGSAHITWVLARPINMADPAQVNAYFAIRRMLVRVLEVDAKFSNRLTKNPFHVAAKMVEPDPSIECGDLEIWQAYLDRGVALTYHTEIWQLETIDLSALSKPLLEIAKETGVRMYPRKPIDPNSETAKKQAQARGIESKTSKSSLAVKGSKLFDAVSNWARHARVGSFETLQAIATTFAASMHCPALPHEIDQIAKSISGWMHTHWWGTLCDDDTKVAAEGWIERKSVNRGVMRGEAADLGGEALNEWNALTEDEKRLAAARRSAASNRSDTDDSIRQAIQQAVREGGKITNKRIATLAGVSEITVKRRRKTLFTVEIDACEKVSNGLLIRPCNNAVTVAPPASPETITGPSLADLAKATQNEIKASAKADRQPIAVYRRLSVAMRKHGAELVDVPRLPRNASDALKTAHTLAQEAHQICRERVVGRLKRAAGDVRKAERIEWHAEHAQDDAGFRARLDDLTADKAVEIERVLREGGDPTKLVIVERKYASKFGAEWNARHVSRGEPVIKKPRPAKRMGTGMHSYDALDLEIDW